MAKLNFQEITIDPDYFEKRFGENYKKAFTEPYFKAGLIGSPAFSPNLPDNFECEILLREPVILRQGRRVILKTSTRVFEKIDKGKYIQIGIPDEGVISHFEKQEKKIQGYREMLAESTFLIYGLPALEYLQLPHQEIAIEYYYDNPQFPSHVPEMCGFGPSWDLQQQYWKDIYDERSICKMWFNPQIFVMELN